MGGSKRKACFSDEHMELFREDHVEAGRGQKPPKGGYPDCGNGLYSLKLDYKQWFEFNLQ